VEVLASIAELVKVLITKISTIFDVIDLSFFVPGGTCMLAFVYMRYVHGGLLPDVSGILAFAIAILGSYVMGLLCFAMGRWFRRATIGRPWVVRLEGRLEPVLEAHGLHKDDVMSAYLKRGRTGRDVLYPRLWAELRQDPSLKPSFDLLTSYWVRAAVYDGLITALFVWSFAVWLALWHDRGFVSKPEVGYGILIFIFVGILTCSREASRSERYQVDEITATLAHARDKRDRELLEKKLEAQIVRVIAASPAEPEPLTPKFTKVIEPTKRVEKKPKP
jgi:hypothetical protein